MCGGRGCGRRVLWTWCAFASELLILAVIALRHVPVLVLVPRYVLVPGHESVNKMARVLLVVHPLEAR